MKKLKLIILSIIGVTGILAVLFWIAFAIVAYRNEYLVLKLQKIRMMKDSYITKKMIQSIIHMV